jgi:hypothetical protein
MGNLPEYSTPHVTGEGNPRLPRITRLPSGGAITLCPKRLFRLTNRRLEIPQKSAPSPATEEV